jgi:hypothetical protein
MRLRTPQAQGARHRRGARAGAGRIGRPASHRPSAACGAGSAGHAGPGRRGSSSKPSGCCSTTARARRRRAALFDDDAADPATLRLRWLGLRASGEKRPAGPSRAGLLGRRGLLRGRETLTPSATSQRQWLAGNSSARRVRATRDLGARSGAGPLRRAPRSAGLAPRLGRRATRHARRQLPPDRPAGEQGPLAGVKRMRATANCCSPSCRTCAWPRPDSACVAWATARSSWCWHRYRQVVAAPNWRVAPVEQTPRACSGARPRDRPAAGLREWSRTGADTALVALPPGAAFAAYRDPAASSSAAKRRIELGAGRATSEPRSKDRSATQPDDHETHRGGHRLRRPGHRRLLCRDGQRRAVRGPRRRQDRQAAPGRTADPRARPGTDRGAAQRRRRAPALQPPTWEGVRFGTIQFIAVGTPPDEDGSADMQHVLAAARASAAT